MFLFEEEYSDEEFSAVSESEEEKQQDRLALKELVKDASGDEIDSISDSEDSEDSEEEENSRKRSIIHFYLLFIDGTPIQSINKKNRLSVLSVCLKVSPFPL